MRKGGESDSRNKSLMKMFNLINIGERSSRGVPNIFNMWEDKDRKKPVIEECFELDRTILTFEFVEKQAIILQRYMNILHNMVKLKRMILQIILD